MFTSTEPSSTPQDPFTSMNAPAEISRITPTTVVTEKDVQNVRQFFDRALDELHMVAPTIVFTQILMPSLASLALSSEKYADKSPIHPEQLRDFVVSLIMHGPQSSQAQGKIKEFKKIYDSLEIPLGNKELNFLAYSLTHKLMQALELYSSVKPAQDDRESWFRVITLAVEQLGATEITDDYSRFVAENAAIESQYLRNPDPLTSQVAEEALGLFTKPLPLTLRPFAKPAVCSVLDPELRKALGLPDISPAKASFYQSVVQKIGKLFNAREHLMG